MAGRTKEDPLGVGHEPRHRPAEVGTPSRPQAHHGDVGTGVGHDDPSYPLVVAVGGTAAVAGVLAAVFKTSEGDGSEASRTWRSARLHVP